MRIVVTGRKGQLVQSMIERAKPNVELVCLGRPEFSLTDHSEVIITAITEARPDLVVSAAAYTQVDKAESDADNAFVVNAAGPRAVAIAARECRVPLIHISTDYVFDGQKISAYREDDQPNPTSVYGASKLAGEEAVLSEYAKATVLRTAWVYSPYGANFVKTMLRLAAGRNEVSVVADQVGNPTSALDIADAVFRVGANLSSSGRGEQCGIFHTTASGCASWADFAEEIFRASARFGGPVARVNHISTSEYPTAAARPGNSNLDCSKLAKVHGVRLPDWHKSVDGVVLRLLNARD